MCQHHQLDQSKPKQTRQWIADALKHEANIAGYLDWWPATVTLLLRLRHSDWRLAFQLFQTQLAG